MKIQFDADKNLANREKHGVFLADASRLEWATALIEADIRRDYGELREIAYAKMVDRLYIAVFTRRDDLLRIISLRKANQREFDYYVSTIDTTNG